VLVPAGCRRGASAERRRHGNRLVTATSSDPRAFDPLLAADGASSEPPNASRENLLVGAQNVQSIASIPWILAPGLFILVARMAFDFLGDHLRDVLDPRSAGARG